MFLFSRYEEIIIIMETVRVFTEGNKKPPDLRITDEKSKKGFQIIKNAVFIFAISTMDKSTKNTSAGSDEKLLQESSQVYDLTLIMMSYHQRVLKVYETTMQSPASTTGTFDHQLQLTILIDHIEFCVDLIQLTIRISEINGTKNRNYSDNKHPSKIEHPLPPYLKYDISRYHQHNKRTTDCRTFGKQRVVREMGFKSIISNNSRNIHGSRH